MGTLLRFEVPRVAAEPDATATRGAQGGTGLHVYRLRHTNAVRLAGAQRPDSTAREKQRADSIAAAEAIKLIAGNGEVNAGMIHGL